MGLKKIVERILKEQFEYDRGSLVFSTERVELSTKPGEDVEGSFGVKGPRNRVVEGTISATELRMEILTPMLAGSEDEIGYRFHAEGLSGGDVLQGNFRIISNQGEYLLPFVVSVEMEHIESSLGDIRNLFHFANLAKTNWQEAVRLFYSADFIRIFTGNDKQYESLYRGLSAIPGSEQNVEEFLLAVSKKQKIEYIPDQTEIHVDNSVGITEHTITIMRNGWGYSALSVSVDGDFLRADKTSLTEADFDGNVCYFKFSLDSDRLHDGNNFGSICFSNAYTTFRIPVYATVNCDYWSDMPAYREKKRLVAELMKQYVSFRSKKISSRTWLLETGKIITKMNALDGESLEFRLYQAQYLITAARVNEGKWILEQIRSQIEDRHEGGETLYCYYLYLTTLCSREETYIIQVSEMIEDVFDRNPDNWRIAWLLQYLAEESSGSKAHRWILLENQYTQGCRSPILYLDSLHLLAQNVTLLTHLESFELSVLEFAARRKLLTAPMIEQIVYLSSREKRYNKHLYKILSICYEIQQQDDILEAVCSQLIKDERTDREAFGWYCRGVDRQLRITRLYEYYMMSVSTDANGKLLCEIPRMVLMYFSYQSNLEYKQNAILYKYIYDNRELYPELFESYRLQIDKFLLDQIGKGHVNRELGFLYQNMLNRQMVDASNAMHVLSILYTCEITIEQDGISEIIVVYDKCEKEMRYPVIDRKAYVPLYGSEYTLLLSDRYDNRFAGSVPFDICKLIVPGHLSQLAIPYIRSGEENLDLFLCELGKSAYTITMENVERYRDLAASDLIRENSRSEIRENLIRFYYDNDFVRQLSEYLKALDPDILPGRERSDMLELMVLTGLYDKALEWLRRYGTYGIDPRSIVRLCSRMSDRDNYLGDPAVAEIVYYAFRKGKYDEEILNFLVRAFSGTVREMRDLWKAAESFRVDTWILCEKIILQMLYSGAYVGEKMDIFRRYCHDAAGADLERAFIAQNAYESFVKDQVTEGFIFTRIGKLAEEGASLPDVCGMAYLKYYAEHGNEEKPSAEVASGFLRQLLDKNIYFPFYRDYMKIMPELKRFADKTMLEYKTHPGCKCVIHYMLSSGTEESKEYCHEEMQEMYDGIFVSAFILFFGEQLQYYITEETMDSGDEGKEQIPEQLTQSGTVSNSDINQNNEMSRYDLINDLMIGMTLQDYSTVDRLLMDYSRRRFMGRHLFQPEL